MPTLQYPNNPNTDTAFVVQDDGTKNRALMTAPQDTSTLELPSNPNSTKGYVTIDGKKQRVVLTADISGGGSGSDQHNLGWYATESALTTAHPTATDGDWAIVGATDTVWVWDTDTTAWKDTGAAGIELPSQTGNDGKFLTTNGTSASWGYTVKQLQIKTTTSTPCYFSTSSPVGGGSAVVFQSIQGQNIQLGGEFTFGCSFISKLYVRSLYYGDNNSQGITVPAVGGTLALQIATLPTAGSTYEGTIYQYTGATDSTYTNGHFYKCVSDGQTPATYSWEEVSVGGSSYTAGTGIDITSGVISVTAPTLMNMANNPSTQQSIFISSTNDSMAGSNRSQCVCIGSYCYGNGTTGIGYNSTVSGAYSVGIGFGAIARESRAIAIGCQADAAAAYSIQIGSGTNVVNYDANTFKVANQNGNYEIMSADGTIPTARLTKVNSTITLTSAGWSSNTQTVNVTGMTATGLVFVSPDPTDQSAYTSAGIICSAQAAGTLTFTCTTTPSADIDVNVVML